MLALIDSKYHPIAAQITNQLKEGNLWFETFEHEPVRTSEEAAKIRSGYTIAQGAKALIVRTKVSGSDKKFVMLVCPGDKRFDNEKVKQIFNAKDVRFATEEEVAEITSGVQPGGVPPFGNLFDLEVVVDPRLLQNEKIVFNAGDRRFSVAMKSSDYVTLVQPKIEIIT
jgi:Ala-tRNA(Pro) deacylase